MSKEKTALQELIEKIESVIGMWKNPKLEMDGLHTLETLKSEASELLEKERQQIESQSKEEAIAFAEWIRENFIGKTWRFSSDTEELYTIYLKSK